MELDRQVIAQITTTLVGFLLFFWISKRLFWTSIIGTIEERQARIKAEFDKVASVQKEVADLKADYSRRIAEIEKEAQARKQDEINHGRQVAEEIIAQTRKQADDELAHTKQLMSIEVDKARATLREEVVRLTLAASERILRERMDDATSRRLVGEFVDELGSAK